MFGLILFVLVLSFVSPLFSRHFYGYRRRRIFPYGGFGGRGTGCLHGPMMHHHPHRHHHHMGHGPMGHGRRW